ncbi:hypothetical protein ACFL35_01285 [Candidatus Riflebacteria bacterium]
MARLTALLFVFFFVILFSTTSAFEKPADSMIKAAQIDLEKYEKQASGLTSAKKVFIKRILRYLPMTEARLNNSRNKNHPSWIETSKRLKELKEKLENLKSGKKPQSNQSKTSSTSMNDSEIVRNFQKSYNSLYNELRRTHISKFVDPVIISDFRKKLSILKHLAGAFKNKEERYAKQCLANFEQLYSWYNKKVASAEKQLGVHKVKDRAREQAEENRLAEEAKKTKDRELKEQKSQEANLTKEKGRKEKIKESSGPVQKEDRFASEKKLREDEKNLRWLNKLFINTRTTFQRLDPVALQKPSEKSQVEKKLKQMQTTVDRFHDLNNPKIQKAIKKFEEIRTKTAKAIQQAAVNARKFKDIDGQLKKIMQMFPMPDWTPFIKKPVTKEKLEKLGEDYSVWEKSYPGFMNFLKEAPKASIKAKSRKFKKYARWFKGQIKRNLDYSRRELEKRWRRVTLDSLNEKAAFEKGYYGKITEKTQNALVNLGKKQASAAHDAERRRAETLANTKMPADAYNGSDKTDILNLAEKKWKEKHPALKILAKGISMPAWDRKTAWRKKPLEPLKKYKVDFSSLQVWVIIKKDERIATQYIVEISKNHMKNDLISVYVPENLNSSGIFKTPMLLKNVQY